jgi:SAM-dependent methyltransferase
LLDTRVPDDWFVGFHHGLAARFWHAAGESMADADVAIVRSLLAPGTVLDAPCGDGRMSVRLVGYDVTGVDISPESVAMARARGVHAVLGDLRDLPAGPFDGALSWGNSFGYVTPAESARSLASFRRAIKPGGTLVLESGSVAESLLLGGIEPEAVYEFGGVRMTATNTYNAYESRLESELLFEAEDGTVERSRAAHHVHTTGEIVRMLKAAGFTNVELPGFELGRRMIAVAS